MYRSTDGWLTLTRWSCLGIAIAALLSTIPAWAGAVLPRDPDPNPTLQPSAEDAPLTEAEEGARNQIGAFNRGQQAYRLEFPTFTSNFSDLYMSVDVETEAYTYEIVLANERQAVTIAWPNRPGLRTVIGIVDVYDRQSSTNLCLSQATTAVNPSVPIFAPGNETDLTCPAGFESWRNFQWSR